MRLSSLIFAFIAVIASSVNTWAAAPTLTNVFPAGGQRGTTVLVKCAGTFMWPVKVWAPGVQAVPKEESGQLEITIPRDLSTDRVWIRLYNAEGASAAFPFLIGGLKEVTEVEPNNKPAEAQVISELGVTVNGLLKEPEADCFSVTLQEGQTMVAALDANTRLGSPMDSILQIASPNGIVLAENHDDLKLDPRLAFKAPKTGQYIVRVFAFPATPDTTIRFNGSANHIYRLTLTTGPFATHAIPLSAPITNPGPLEVAGWNLPAEVRLNPVVAGGERLANDRELEVIDELRRNADAQIGFAFLDDSAVATRVRLTPYETVNNSAKANDSKPLPVRLPSSITGCLRTRNQTDDYLIPLVKGQQVVISAESRSLDLQLDPVLKLLGPTGAVISDVDDTGATRDALIAYTAAADGDHKLIVGDRFRHGSDRSFYLLTVRLEQPDFELSLASDTLTVAADKPAEVTVKIQRRGTAAEAVGPITVEFLGLPEGVTSAPVVSETTGPTAAEVKLTLTTTGVEFAGPVRIQGKAAAPKVIQRLARTPARLGVAFDSVWLTGTPKPQ